MKKILYGTLLLAVAACGRNSGDSKNRLAFNDFESLDGWSSGVVNPSLNKEEAHSGVYSVKVNPGIDYSLGYNNEVGKISNARLQKIHIHAWAKVPNDKAVGVLVTEVKNEGEDKSALWDGLNMVEEAKAKGFNKWIEIDKTLNLPESLKYNSRLLVYLWRGSSSQPVYLDDLEISRAD